MTDDTRKRPPRRDYAGRAVTPATGHLIRPPIAGVASGTCDSDDARMAEHFEDVTPLEVLRRIEAKLNPPTVEVDASAFDADTRWRDFDAMRDEVDECRKERLRRAKWRKAVWGSAAAAASAVIALLTWIATSLDARATEAAEERIRIHMLKEHEMVLDDFKTWRAEINARVNTLDLFILPRRMRTGDNP